MNNLVEISKNKQAVTTSIRVAEVFGKRHDNVMKSVNRLIGELRTQEDFNHLKNEVVKFVVDSYKDTKGESRKQYIMNRDGFTLLAMGFTGKKALEFKIKYINAFNEMEAKLRAMYPCGAAAVGKPGACNEVAVKEHTRSLPVCRKKEIVLSDKAKTEIGGIVKACVSAELGRLVSGGSAKTESWEVSDGDLLRSLHDWYATKHKQATLSAQKVISENTRLSEENRELQRRLNLISQALG